ncbi:hypothetical protein AVV36_gp207 [Pectobacterium bacteriophage PM2]|uniref:Uncharacterized protein n=1 Tax=Pectobacterium bacteriophage PM2 TaxID=1429794 RepID=A0A0A0Q0W9_9CAUD|nr:hypothetical protein AVV36_gp207 [Pectobacterium bacteriophage PM2]AHY25203.1 hypothetical protein PM2_241 [Pectobacterium bacteriophage PM2]
MTYQPEIEKLKELILNIQDCSFNYGKAYQKYDSYQGYDSTLLYLEDKKISAFTSLENAVKRLNSFLDK